jgi:hypothetical protein
MMRAASGDACAYGTFMTFTLPALSGMIGANGWLVACKIFFSACSQQKAQIRARLKILSESASAHQHYAP